MKFKCIECQTECEFPKLRKKCPGCGKHKLEKIVKKRLKKEVVKATLEQEGVFTNVINKDLQKNENEDGKREARSEPIGKFKQKWKDKKTDFLEDVKLDKKIVRPFSQRKPNRNTKRTKKCVNCEKSFETFFDEYLCVKCIRSR